MGDFKYNIIGGVMFRKITKSRFENEKDEDIFTGGRRR